MRGTGTPMPPTDPLIYRFYELVMVNGPAWKALIEEEFGDGIMSAIDFDMAIERQPNPKGDRVKITHDAASSCRSSITAPPATCRSTGSRRSERAAQYAERVLALIRLAETEVERAGGKWAPIRPPGRSRRPLRS